MELTRDWTLQATRAAGVTALAPAVLLGSAVLLAAGAGFGGLGSLGQVAGGPSVPPVEQVTRSASSSTPGRQAPTPVAALAPAPASTASARPGGSGSARTGGAGRGTQVRSFSPAAGPRRQGGSSPVIGTPKSGTPSPRTPSTPQAGTPGSPSAPATPVAPTTPQLPQTPRLPSAPSPVQQIIDTTRGIGQSLPNPVGPLTERVLDTVTGLSP